MSKFLKIELVNLSIQKDKKKNKVIDDINVDLSSYCLKYDKKISD
jgi:hypothetical protein